MEPSHNSGSARRAWLFRHPRLAPALVFALTSAVTLAGVGAIEQSARHERRLALERDASDVSAALQRRAVESTATLSAAAALFSMRQIVSRPVFASFVDAVADNRGGIGALGMGWAPAVPAAQVGAFEAAMRRMTGRPDFAVFPRPRGLQQVVPVTYLDPESGKNRLAIGYDMFSDAVRREAMNRAVQGGRPAASGKLHLVQDSADRASAGFIIYMPVFDGGAGRRSLKGFVYLPFQADDFVKPAFRLADARSLSIELFDRTVDDVHRLAGPAADLDDADQVSRRINIAGRDWVLRLGDPRAERLSTLAVLVLGFGLVLAVLLALIAQLIVRRVIADEAMLERQAREAAIRNSLTRELNHRVKNTLANVLSIMALTRRRATGIDDFAEALGGRIRALSATHDLLSKTDWTSAAIGAVVESELAPYMAGTAGSDCQISLSGPQVQLAPNDAMSLGLAVHELATNAAKYGALSTDRGRVTVSWHLMTPTLAELHWREADGPPVDAPSRRGFGHELIEKIVAHELGNAVDLRFEPGGVECRLRVPVRRQSDFALREMRAP